MKRFSQALTVALGLFAAVNGSCKSREQGGPSNPSDLNDRLSVFQPSGAPDLSQYAGDLVVSTFNIQSGLSLNCAQNIQAQIDALAASRSHYYALQEVDIDSTHCSCNQAQIAADTTNHQVSYFRTIYNQGGKYGHASGSVYGSLEQRYHIFKTFSTELRGILATRSQPPQLGGRDLWFVSTHLQFDSVPVRTAQATELVQFVQGLAGEFPNALFIVPGDMYVQFTDSDYTVMSNYFVDTWVQFSGGQTGGSTHPSNNPVVRDDYVWYKAPAGLTVDIISHIVDARTLSDHARVQVSFRFSGQGTPAPTSAPTPAPTAAPTATPTSTPTGAPTSTPTDAPTPAPTDAPTATPTNAPTSTPTPSPTSTPTEAPTAPTCNAGLSYVKRAGGAFSEDGKLLDVYDIQVINKGTCTINSAKITSPFATTQAWNYNAESGVIDIFGGVSPASVYSSAGFIGADDLSLDTSAFEYGCSDSCTGTRTPSSIASCNVMVETTARPSADGHWTQDGLDYQIWDLSATNYGSTPANNIKFYIELPAGYSITQSWNLEVESAATAHQLVAFDLFGNSLSANGGSFSKTSGVVVAGPTPLNAASVKISLVSVTCN